MKTKSFLFPLLSWAIAFCIPSTACAEGAKDAQAHFAAFQARFALEDYEAAFREIEAAEVLDPGNAAYPFEAGAAFLKAYSFKRIPYERIRDKLAAALEAFRRAKAKGYETARVDQKIGECHYWLYRKEEALSWVGKALALNLRRLEALLGNGKRSAEEEKETVSRFYELVENLFYIDASGGDPVAPAQDILRASKGYLSAAGTLRTAMVTCFANAARILGDYAFGKGLWDEALSLYRSIVASEKETGHVIPYHRSWHMDEMVELVERRKGLGEIRPQYVHPILVVYVTETRMLAGEGGTEVLENVTPGQKRNYGVWLSAMKHALEAMSGGGWSVSFLTHDAKAEVVEGSDVRQHKPGSFLPDYAPWKLANDYDTFCVISHDVSGLAGKVAYPYVPFTAYGVWRGWFQCGNGREYNFRMWLHEFYHTVGFLQDAGAVHGWSGTKETELAFYVRHFATTLGAKGWGALNYRFTYPETVISEERFRALAEEFRRIPRRDVLKAEALMETARELSRTDRSGAAALCEQACALYPYQEWALKHLAELYGSAKDQREKAIAYNTRYAKVLPEGAAERRLGDLYRDLGDGREAEAHYRKAASALQASLGENPRDGQGAAELAELFFFSLGQKALAAPYYRIAVQYGPEAGLYKWCLHGGQALHEAGEYREALSFYGKGLEILLRTDPSSSYIAHYYYWMALAHGEGLGDRAEAVRILEQAVREGHSRYFTTDLLRKYR